jgi:nicotinate dehydrogenase subunit B
MTGLIPDRELSRRTFLRGGALVVGFAMGGAAFTASTRGASIVAGPPDSTQVDSWLVVNADNTVSIFPGKQEVGQGTWTGFQQVAAEELNLPVASIRPPTWFETSGPHPNPGLGRTAGSNGMFQGGPPLQQAAAQAYQALLGLASANLGVPVSSLSASGGVISGGGKSVKYSDLLAGKLFNTRVSATVPVKAVSSYTVVTKNVPRYDIPDIVSGKFTYVQNIRLPGMLHGRVVRPRGQAYYTPTSASTVVVPPYGTSQAPLSVDLSSIAHIPNVQVVQNGGFIGVVAPHEYDAIQGAALLKVTWADTEQLPGVGNLYGAMRNAVTSAAITTAVGDVGQGFASAAKIVSATYEWPFQMHGPIGPQCCVADVTPGGATIYTPTQDGYGTGALVAQALKMPQSSVRTIVVNGASTYGHDAGEDDAPVAAAIMSQTVGKPVRAQLMRWDSEGWDNFGPAAVADIRGGLDANGRIIAYDYTSYSSGGAPTYSTGDQYAPNIPNRRLTSKITNPWLRTGPLRGPGHVQPGWSSEQMMDELAHAAGMDPLAFRKLHLTDVHQLGVIDAVAQLSNWQTKVAASNLSSANVVTGRGISLSNESHPGSLVYDAAVADIEVNKKTGRVTVMHLYGAQDSGLAVNPSAIENQMVGMLMQGVSRALLEQVAFTKSRVSSLDWVTYPTLRFKDAPPVTTTVVQRLDDIYRGAGESLVVPTVSAIANAFFDATGVRIRTAPMTPARVRATLKAAGVS